MTVACNESSRLLLRVAYLRAAFHGSLAEASLGAMLGGTQCSRAAWPAHIRLPHSSGKAVIFTVASSVESAQQLLVMTDPVLMPTTSIGLGLINSLTLKRIRHQNGLKEASL